jgi:hypothetical protein
MALSWILADCDTIGSSHRLRLKRPTPHASPRCPINLTPRLRSALFERAQETEVYACDVEACIRLPSRTIHLRNLGASVPSSYLGQVYFILASLDDVMESCDFTPRINMLILKSKPSDIRERPLAHATILIGITEQAPDFLFLETHFGRLGRVALGRVMIDLPQRT